MDLNNIDELIMHLLGDHLEQVFNADELMNLSNEKYALVRNAGFGASDSSKLLGINKWTTKEELLKEKTSLKPLDDSISFKASVRKGKDLEPWIISRIATFLNTIVGKPQWMYMYKGTKLSVNFDGVTNLSIFKTFKDSFDLIPIEIKVATEYGRKYYDFSKAVSQDVTNEHWRLNTDDLLQKITLGIDKCGFPDYYYTQLQQQMMFLESPVGILGVLDDKEWTIRLFCVARDGEIQRAIQEAEKENRWVIRPIEEIKRRLLD